MRLENKTILAVTIVNTALVTVISILTVIGFISIRALPVIGFCLFWATYIFFRLSAQRTDVLSSSPHRPTWKYCEILAGIYFAGALWAVISFARQREWYQIFGAAFAAGFGAFCLAMSRRLQGRAARGPDSK